LRILFLTVAGDGQGSLSAPGAATMTGITRNQKGQNLIEYAIIVAVITAAMVAMSTYVYRSVQATQKAIQEGYAQ
jgi:Flp pilus assembly pilin Flp